MRIAILGAGLIGITLAYELMRRGHGVTVIDRQQGPGQECSFSNGGQLSYSHAEPWASPKLLPKILQWLGKKDAPLVFTLRADPAMWQWALRFLARCTPARNLEGTRTMLRLSLYSRECFRRLHEPLSIDFAFSNPGTLHVYQDKAALQHAITHAKFQEGLGCPFSLLTPSELVQKEPALATIGATLAGGLHFPLDEIGDAYRFTTGLAGLCHGVDFQYNTTITKLETHGARILGVVTDKGAVTADAYVMALGAESQLFSNSLNLRLPIYPVKGYSTSLPLNAQPFSLHTSILHETKKIVVTPLGNQLRIAGTAELVGYDTAQTPYRLQAIMNAAEEILPGIQGMEHATHWACLRPATPDGAPVLGATGFQNLYINTGHGSLGWTLCAGSAAIVADVIEGKPPAIALEGLTLARFR